jgi:hypothetical protein
MKYLKYTASNRDVYYFETHEKALHFFIGCLGIHETAMFSGEVYLNSKDMLQIQTGVYKYNKGIWNNQQFYMPNISIG